MSRPGAKILISYRRADAPGMAGRIFDRLVQHYGRDSVFMDVDSIPFGVDFREHIQNELNGCDALLAVIGPQWAGDGTRQRIHERNDPVRIEVEAALQRGIPVLPVLVVGAPMPRPEDLPETLQNLAYRNAAPVDSGRDFHGHVDRLIRDLDRLLDRIAERQKAEKERAAQQAEAERRQREQLEAERAEAERAEREQRARAEQEAAEARRKTEQELLERAAARIAREQAERKAKAEREQQAREEQERRERADKAAEAFREAERQRARLAEERRAKAAEEQRIAREAAEVKAKADLEQEEPDRAARDENGQQEQEKEEGQLAGKKFAEGMRRYHQEQARRTGQLVLSAAATYPGSPGEYVPSSALSTENLPSPEAPNWPLALGLLFAVVLVCTLYLVTTRVTRDERAYGNWSFVVKKTGFAVDWCSIRARDSSGSVRVGEFEVTAFSPTNFAIEIRPSQTPRSGFTAQVRVVSPSGGTAFVWQTLPFSSSSSPNLQIPAEQRADLVRALKAAQSVTAAYPNQAGRVVTDAYPLEGPAAQLTKAFEEECLQARSKSS